MPRLLLPALAASVLALAVAAPSALAAQLNVHPDTGLRMVQPVDDVALEAACEGTPPAPTWRLGTEGFTVALGSGKATAVEPRLAGDLPVGPMALAWTVAWDPEDVDLVATEAALDAALLLDTGQGFAEAARASSSAEVLLGGEATFGVPLSAGTRVLPAGAALGLEVALRGTDACADGASGVRLVRGVVEVPATWDYDVAVEPQVGDGHVLLWARVTSAWGGYDEEPLGVDLDLDGPSEPEGRALLGPYALRQDDALMARGERLFSWTWEPGLQGAAPGEYRAKVTAYPLRVLEGEPRGHGEATVTVAPSVDTPSPALLAAVAALVVAALAARRTAL